MEQPKKMVEPAEFRRQARLVGFMGLAGDVAVASVFIMIGLFDEMVNYILALVLVSSGVVLLYLFSYRFPRNYERNYARLQGMKKD